MVENAVFRLLETTIIGLAIILGIGEFILKDRSPQEGSIDFPLVSYFGGILTVLISFYTLTAKIETMYPDDAYISKSLTMLNILILMILTGVSQNIYRKAENRYSHIGFAKALFGSFILFVIFWMLASFLNTTISLVT